MLETLSSAFDLLLVVIGFGLVIFIHELGHFLAAKWAGVRVHQFAIGFGTPVFSWRKGMGFALGSTEKKLLAIVREKYRESGVEYKDKTLASFDLPEGISPTEYRLNWIPFGGYVKMLGQEDMDPAATSDSPDSYTQKPVWKRMVIISAGVVMNILLAATLFVIVYMVGRDVPTSRIGAVLHQSPAQQATLVSGDPAGTPARLLPGDLITRIKDKKPKSFNDVALEVAMSRRGAPMQLEVERAGAPTPLVFEMTPRKGATGMLEIGVVPAVSNRVVQPPRSAPEIEKNLRKALDDAGLVEVEPGMPLVSVNGESVDGLWPLTHAFENSDGAPVRIEFESDSGRRVTLDVRPKPELQLTTVQIPGHDDQARQPHLLGLAPAVEVASLEDRARQAGLEIGDVVVQVGAAAWPDIATLIAEVRRHARADINLTALRDGELVDLVANVDSKGRIGFGFGQSTESFAFVSRVPKPAPPKTESETEADDTESSRASLAASRLDLAPGSNILSVNNVPVENFINLRSALRDATAEAHASGADAAVTLRVQRPLGAELRSGPIETVEWTLTSAEIASLHELGWNSPISELLFELEEKRLQTSNPIEAVVWGVQDTHNMMLKTYLTFVRLAQGSVAVDQLKGPVGIAHLGTMVVEKGLMDLLFFLGLISVNLAVINFLPIPIADGGHFIMLLIEQATGKPVSPVIQNIMALIGLALIATVFVVVTYNDITALFGG